ncbi:MAG: protein-L-isoaspartate O-methyltransferase [Gammaproteobacteria bacterium]|nr:protein-L-isoaspartate O-methyltransferase [Gammaproteobacteria bacterium]MCH9715626.1 protein-L-isoaspartate O-methyltransferase [Gammaproteobacteria bacterium]MCH9763318.1 protein-L-isoaspartate O-methyltransferase [Gammaproteobacteria bacterium]
MKNQLSRINMIKQQLRTGNILDEAVLSLYDKIPRHLFVPEALQNTAYSDLQLPLAHTQRMMTPLEEASILQALKLKGHEHVLEIGTGSGFLTALLSHSAAHVTSIDCYPEFTESANKKLNIHGNGNVTLITADASQGWLDNAPYDVVVCTGALQRLSRMHQLQVIPGGKLFAIIGESPVMQGQLHTLSHDEVWHTELLFETELPLLTNQMMSAQHFVF